MREMTFLVWTIIGRNPQHEFNRNHMHFIIIGYMATYQIN